MNYKRSQRLEYGGDYMREKVIIKSFPNGIALYLNGELPFEKILEEVGYKFSDARNFFGAATMALSIEGRVLNEVEEIRVLETIRENSDLNIACIVGRDDTVNKNYVRALVFQGRPEEQGGSGDGEQHYHAGGCLPGEHRDQREKHYYSRGTLRQGLRRRKRPGGGFYSSV